MSSDSKSLSTSRRQTIPEVFFHGIESHTRPDAMLHRAGGQWAALSHAEVLDRVIRLAGFLEERGVAHGDRVAILSENRPEWAIADYAILGVGGVDVPLYPSLPANQIAYILKDAGVKGILVSTRAQLSKIQGIRDSLPTLEWVVSFELSGAEPGVVSLAEALDEGGRAANAFPVGWFRARTEQVSPGDLATLIYTSGTSGEPKGVMLSHRNLTSNLSSVLHHGVYRARTGDLALSFLPLSHAFERLVDYYYWHEGIGIAYVANLDAVADAMQAVRPHVMVAVPRFFEKIHAKVFSAQGVKKHLLEWAARVGEQIADAEVEGRHPSYALEVQAALADRLVFSKIRARTGGRLRALISGGAPLSGDLARFFYAAGLPIYEGYGLTETAPVLSANRPGAIRFGTVGTALPEVEVRLGEEGEILARGANIMLGYWNQPDETAAVIDSDGWFHTGDIGVVDAEGFLKITDRIKNLIVTAGGKNIAPQPIEMEAARSPFISQVVMLGDQRAFPVLLLVPEFSKLEEWARSAGLTFEDRSSLLALPEVESHLRQEALGRLQGLAKHEMPKKVALIPEEFSVDDGTLTPTLKVKRRVVEERYRTLIDALYADRRA